MKKHRVSNNVIRRMPRYLRKLDDLAYHAIELISSSELGRQMGLTPSQIRQDFSCFGEFGQQGYGYQVQSLRDEISAIMGMKRGYSVILIGVGNLGHALLENFNFEINGFKMLGGFDVDARLIGQEVAGVPIYDTASLPEFLSCNHVDIAVLTVPRRVADNVAGLVTSCGVRSIWNFTNIELKISDPQVLVEDVHFSDSLLALGYFLSERDSADRD